MKLAHTSLLAFILTASVAVADVEPAFLSAGTTGLDGWQFVPAGSVTIASSGTAMDSPGAGSWKLNSYAEMDYYLGGELGIGQSISLMITIGEFNASGEAGFQFGNNYNPQFSVIFDPQPEKFLWVDSNGVETVIEGYSKSDADLANGNYLTFEFVREADNLYSLSINNTTVVTGVEINGSINSMQIYSEGNESSQFYANNLQIVPEPATYALILAGAGIALAVSRRGVRKAAAV